MVSVRGDEQDVLSRGFICPKAYGLKQLHEDPDRLRTPLVRRDGELREATWDEAFEEIDRRLTPLLAEHGRNAVAVYIGNPNAHNLSSLLYGPVWLRALGSQNIFSASTVDQMPKQVSSGLMFGHLLSVPVPDVDRTDHLLILGANPLVSNGSLLTAPDMRGRLRAIRERGGKVVVVDPRRTRTAEEADEHHYIRPGADALLLAAMASTLVEEDLVDPGRLAEHVEGLEQVTEVAAGLLARARRRGVRHRGRRDPAHGARAGGGRARRRVRPHRDLHAGVRDARQLARGRAQRADRQPRPRGRRDVPARRRGPAQRVRHPRRGQGRAHRALAEPRARAARDLRRAARRRARRGDGDARRGPGARAGDRRRQPGGVARPTPSASRRRSRASTSCWRWTST